MLPLSPAASSPARRHCWACSRRSKRALPKRTTRFADHRTGGFDGCVCGQYETGSSTAKRGPITPAYLMRLADLLTPGMSRPAGADDLEITSVTADSRAVVPGALFAALPGSRVDGTRFIPDAIAKGAAAILVPAGADVPDVTVPIIRAPDARRALALVAAKLFPAQPEASAAVTGTSGKTSVVEFTRQIYAALGRRAASIGTIGVVKPDGSRYGSLTTPDPISLHQMLADLAADGVTHLAFEAPSHCLDQRRLDGGRPTDA